MQVGIKYHIVSETYIYIYMSVKEIQFKYKP
jgi:hypothetical protein